MNLRLFTIVALLSTACATYAMNEGTTPEKLNQQQESTKNEKELALFAAIKAGNLPKVKELVEGGADLDYTDDMGRTVFHWAAEQGDVFVYLLDLLDGAGSK